MSLLVDAMCGKLATYLRMCGYDAEYALDRGVEADDALLELARSEGRRILTRDQDLAAGVDDAVLLEAKDIEGQLRELRTLGFDLSLDRPSRCSRCNAALERLDSDDATPEYAPSPGVEAVWRCPACGQCYWRGSHWEDVRDRLASL